MLATSSASLGTVFYFGERCSEKVLPRRSTITLASILLAAMLVDIFVASCMSDRSICCLSAVGLRHSANQV